MHVCISVLIWVSAESHELLNSYNNFLFGFGYLHCFNLPVFRQEIFACSHGAAYSEKELLVVEPCGNSGDLHQENVHRIR